MESAKGRPSPPLRASGTFDVTLTSEEEKNRRERSAGYVAMERVTGRLHCRRGTFVLQHTGTMTRGAASLTVSVVPDSGTGELAGLTGTMTITIAGGPA